jgi:hypothetical protein
MSLDKKILNEIERYRSINNYITEQNAPLPPEEPGADLGALAPAPGEQGAIAPPAPEGVPSAETATLPQVIDVDVDKDVEKIDDDGESEETESSESEELDVTDLVDSQKNIEKKQDEYFENLFSQISKMEEKLSEMDAIMNKLNTLENKIEKYREKTPQEKLELRTYDSYPFNQKLTDFFDDKQDEMQKTGKNDYVLTSDQVTDINSNDIKNSFQPNSGEDNNYQQ